MSRVNPLITVEIIPLIGLSRHDTADTESMHAISAPLAKLQLMELSLGQMFPRGWIRLTHSTKIRDKDCDCTATQAQGSAASSGMFLRRHKHIQRKNSSIVIAGSVFFKGHCCGNSHDNMATTDSNSTPITYLQSENPLCERGVPCHLQGYMLGTREESFPYDVKCCMTDGTCVYVLPHRDIWHTNIHYLENHLCSSLLRRTTDHNEPTAPPSIQLIAENDADPLHPKLIFYNQETVQSLILRMSLLLKHTVWVGTAPQSLRFWNRFIPNNHPTNHELYTFLDKQRQHCLHHETPLTIHNGPPPNTRHGSSPLLLQEGALLLYNSHSNSGKTSLVTTIANEVLHCDSVHVLSAPAIFAKYGTCADAALMSILHESAMRGALKGMDAGSMGRVCIVLDRFETFLPSSIAESSYTPVLNAMASYLNRLVYSMMNNHEFPHPSCFGLDSSSTPGFVLPVSVCLIGVMTSSDVDSNSGQRNRGLSKALGVMGGGRLLMGLPSASTRLSALRHSIRAASISLDDEAEQFLPEMAAAMTWGGGRSLSDSIRAFCSSLKHSGTRVVSKSDLLRCSANTSLGCTGFSPHISPSTNTAPTIPQSFSSVGGNRDAKLALEDALALNPKKRRLLSSFGLDPPTGVLLYGPPGTGKTLLARAVAQAMTTGSTSATFLSLRASDIMRPEVGNSEKLVVSAFETARESAPSVIFIDEFQALFGTRDGSGVIVGQLASTLLQCMDDVSRWTDVVHDATDRNERIVVLGATNTPWMIDKAFLRPGRFDRTVFVGLPSLQDREEILRIHIHRMILHPDIASSGETLCKSMAKVCRGFSGADLAALCRAAAVRSLNENDGVREGHFMDAYLKDVSPSSNDELVRRISNWSPRNSLGG